MYGCEAWTINKQTHRRLEAVETWFLRRMLSYHGQRRTNEMVSKEVETNRSLMKKMRKQRATFFGHVMRREGLKHFLTTGELDRKRSMGRERVKMLDSLNFWLGAGRVTDIMSAARDRDVWKDMIASAMRPGPWWMDWFVSISAFFKLLIFLVKKTSIFCVISCLCVCILSGQWRCAGCAVWEILPRPSSWLWSNHDRAVFIMMAPRHCYVQISPHFFLAHKTWTPRPHFSLQIITNKRPCGPAVFDSRRLPCSQLNACVIFI